MSAPSEQTRARSSSRASERAAKATVLQAVDFALRAAAPARSLHRARFNSCFLPAPRSSRRLAFRPRGPWIRQVLWSFGLNSPDECTARTTPPVALSSATTAGASSGSSSKRGYASKSQGISAYFRCTNSIIIGPPGHALSALSHGGSRLPVHFFPALSLALVVE